MSESAARGNIPQLLPGEQLALRDEAKRIKTALYAEYGSQIEEMMLQRGADGTSQQQPTHIELRARRIEELLSSQTPLRRQVRSCQHDAMSRLIEAAEEDAARGVDVNSRLQLLLKLKADLEQSSLSPQK